MGKSKDKIESASVSSINLKIETLFWVLSQTNAQPYLDLLDQNHAARRHWPIQDKSPGFVCLQEFLAGG